MTPLIYGASGVFLLLTLIWAWRILYSYRLIHRQRITADISRDDDSRPAIRLILPVLNEQARLVEFVDYFQNVLQPEYPRLELWIVTTERERNEYPGSATLTIAVALSKSNSTVHHLHYPHVRGVMAHQLNYAIKRMPADGVYAIYNADSRPEPGTFGWIASQFINTEQMIFQQYGMYTKNYSYVSKQKFSPVLIANMYWQCRWAIGFEYYRAASAIRRKRWPSYLRPFNYCIGHGLFVSASFIEKVQFSENTINEDAILGLEAALNGAPIRPVPYFDLSDSPDSVSSIYQQKTNWFQGPYQSPIYYQLLRAKYPTANRFLLFLNCLKLLSHAVYWVTGPLSVAACLVAATFALNESVVAFLVLCLPPLSFLVIPGLMTHYASERLFVYGHSGDSRPHTAQLLRVLSVGSIPAYIIHGAAGVRGFIVSKSILRGVKVKTKMMQYGEV